MDLNEVYTLKEASQIWGISDSNLRNALVKFNRFEQQIKEGTVKKSCGTWLVTRQAMIQIFGQPKKEEKMMFENLSSKAKARAMEEVSDLMKSHPSQYGQFRVDDMKDFMKEQELAFDSNGYLTDDEE